MRWRLGAAGVALLVAGAIALDVSRPWSIGRIASRAGRGFLDFYDVLVPFDAVAHPLMHGVVLLAVFLFTALAALAVAARRPLLAGLVLVAGAGWPATILPGNDDLGRGAFVLAAVLALVAWLRPEARRAPPQILVGIGIVVVALLVSSSGAVAKGQFVDWENWDFYNKPGKPVNVEYVWRANYDGIEFPKERTRVFTVQAPARSVYWRATTLDAFTDDHWDEDLYALYAEVPSNPVTLTDDPLLPAAARDPVRLDAGRRDDRRAARRAPRRARASPCSTTRRRSTPSSTSSAAWRVRSGLSRAAPSTRCGATRHSRTRRGSPSPRPTYPPEIALDRQYLRLQHSGAVPPFGSPEYGEWARTYFADTFEGQRYRPLYDEANRIAGRATNPYAAAVAIEAYFRSAGGFVYDEQPPRAGELAPLVHFVTRTKRGYCQHFAGAMALMLRYLGIPARVAAGFSSGVYDEERKQWTVYDRDAHTWVEVWFNGYGWLPFDPTPGRGTLGGPYTTSSTRFDATGAAGVLSTSAILGGAVEARRLLRFELGNLGRRGADAEHRPERGGAGRLQRAAGRAARAGLALFVVLGALAAALLFVARKARPAPEPVPDARSAPDRRCVPAGARRVPARPAHRRPAERRHARARRVPRPPRGGRRDGLRRCAREGSLRAACDRERGCARGTARGSRAVRRGLRRALPPGRRFRGLFSLRSLFAS